MPPDTEEVSFDDTSVKAAFDPNRKTDRFDPEVGKIYQITFETQGGVPRKRHYGRRYDVVKDHSLKLTEQDIRKGLCILPNPESGEMTVFGPVAEGKEKWGYRRCTSNLGFCPCCVSEKTKLDKKKDKRYLQPAADIYGANVFVWLTDDKGNLLDKSSKRPIDAEGRFIDLDSEGLWDQESYVESTKDKGEPTGKVHFYQFGSDKFVQIRQQKRASKKGGLFTLLNILIECTDPNFKKVSMTALRHEDSAANYRRPMMDQLFKKDGIKALGKWLCKEISPDELVYFYGLEQGLLGQYTVPEDEPGDSLASPPENGGSAETPPGADVGGSLDESEAEPETPPTEEPSVEDEVVAPGAVSDLLDEL